MENNLRGRSSSFTVGEQRALDLTEGTDRHLWDLICRRFALFHWFHKTWIMDHCNFWTLWETNGRTGSGREFALKIQADPPMRLTWSRFGPLSLTRVVSHTSAGDPLCPVLLDDSVSRDLL